VLPVLGLTTSSPPMLSDRRRTLSLLAALVLLLPVQLLQLTAPVLLTAWPPLPPSGPRLTAS
jgi:hypothetical protein